MNRPEVKIPHRSIGLVAPIPEVIARQFRIEQEKMIKSIQDGNTLYIRLDWGVMVDNLNQNPYIGTE